MTRCIRTGLRTKTQCGWWKTLLTRRFGESSMFTRIIAPPFMPQHHSILIYPSTVNLCALRHVDIEPPYRPRPPVSHEDPRDTWTPYPKQMASMPGHLSCVFHRWCDLCCIMIDVTRTFFNMEDEPSPSRIISGQNIERQLQGWHANLPSCLRIEETTVPHVFILQ